MNFRSKYLYRYGSLDCFFFSCKKETASAAKSSLTLGDGLMLHETCHTTYQASDSPPASSIFLLLELGQFTENVLPPFCLQHPSEILETSRSMPSPATSFLSVLTRTGVNRLSIDIKVSNGLKNKTENC